jgi:Magnesium chelatase, subunit ChlI C-terminal
MPARIHHDTPGISPCRADGVRHPRLCRCQRWRGWRASARLDDEDTPEKTLLRQKCERGNTEVDGKTIRLLPDAQKLLEQAMERLRLSPRGQTRTMRVARTIADLAGAETVARVHIAKALAFPHRTPWR